MPSPSDFGWAVVGPGTIAQRFGAALRGIAGARLAAVAGRDASRAQAFAAEWQDARAPAFVATDLAAVVARRDVHAVYIATPHAFHADAVRTALAAGKPVLCEKPMTPNAASTRALIELAQRERVFLMEAVWTRFLPVPTAVQGWLQAGEIGAVRTMQSSLCLNRPFTPGGRRYTAALAGGTLLDIGIYCITVSRMALPGVPVQGFDLRAVLGGEDVDVRTAVTLDFGDGRWSQFQTGFFGNADNAFRINGFEYQIEEAMRCMRAGLVESPGVPHAETLAVVELIDAMRARIGVRYPFE
jgi:predicted dehydrogenase